MTVMPATSSGSLAVSAGAAVWAPTINAGSAVSSANQVGACSVAGIVIIPAAADATFNLYDGTSTSGLLLFSALVKASTTSLVVPLSIPIKANTGLFYSLAGTSATAIVHFLPGA